MRHDDMHAHDETTKTPISPFPRALLVTSWRIRFSIARAMAILWLCFCGSGAALADFSFVHVSDIHIGAGDNHKTDAALFSEISILTPLPAFVINTGDVCETGTDAQYELYRETMKSLSIPAYVAPGNHDVRWNPRGKEGCTLGVGQPLYQSWDYENVHFVTLDATVLLEHWGHISQAQLDWLKADLESVGTEKPVVIGFHHWIGRDTVQVDNEQKLMDLVAPYNVVLWTLGHGHSDIQWSINGVPATMVKGLYQGSYNLITVTNDTLTIRKRRWRDVKANAKEMVRDKSVPESREVEWVDVLTAPLKKQARPGWTAGSREVDGVIEIHAERGDLPADALIEFRIDGGKFETMGGEGGRYAVRVRPGTLKPGEHVVTVQATLADGRAYQQPVRIKVPGQVAPVWETNVGGAVQSRLGLAGDLVLVTTMGNDLVALDKRSGAERWRVRTEDSVFSSPHVDGETVYFGSADHHVYAVELASGHVRWKTKAGGAVLAGPAVAKGIVCVGSVDTKVYGLDAQSGQVKWTVQGANMFQSKTATDGERFFVGGWDNYFRCIDAETGKENWAIKLGREQKLAPNFSAFAPAIASPAVGDGLVYVSTNDGILHALRISDGSEAWNVDWKKMGYSSPLFHQGKVYCALSDQGRVFCVDAATGKMDWEAGTGSVIYDSSFCEGNGMVLIGCVNGVVTALAQPSGVIQWQYKLAPGHLLGSPVADDGHVFVGSMNGNVTALPLR